jgi:hypothetical protein
VKAVRQLATWVTPATHARAQALAVSRGVSVSSLLADLLDDALDDYDPSSAAGAAPWEARPDRVAIRLRPGDVKAIGRRATVRRMKPSTYIAALVRSHLVADPPLPSVELAVLERATAEVSAIGRNLNQIARAINSGAPVPHGTASVIGQSIETVEAVREAAKGYVRVAVASWEAPLG